jgi:hypothetical protein
MLQAANITLIFNIVIGSIFVLITGFFVMQIILAAISLATGFDSSKKSYESATKQLTGAIKGLGLALIAYFLLNTILNVFGINTETESITSTLGNQIYKLFSCLRNFKNCE